MKAFLAVARREVADRRFVLLAAAAMSLFPFLLPAARHLSGATAHEARDWTAVFVASSIAAGLAVALGSTVFAGDLSSRRAGFFFSRPISAAALWAGKLAGAFALVLAGLLLAIGPTWIASGGLLPLQDLGWGSWTILGSGAGALLLLVLLSNAIATMTRSRSSLAFLDLTAGVAVAFAGARAASRLLAAEYQPRTALLAILAAAVFAALLIAAYWSVARGRTDIRAAHRALSGALWGLLAAGTAAFVLYAAWVLAAPPSAFSAVEYASAAGGDWLFVGGYARSAHAGFLYDTRSNRFERTGGAGWTTTRSGDVAAWLQQDPSKLWSLHVARLRSTGALSRETRVTFSRPISSLALSPDGSRVAALEGSLLTVSEIETGRTLASVRALEAQEYATLSFVSPDVVRVLRRHGIADPRLGPVLRLDVLELDVPAKSVTITGTSDEPRGAFPVLESPSGDRLLLREKGGTRITLRDARTLAVLATLREGEPLASAATTFLSDGGVVLGLSDDRASWIDVFSPQGTPTGRIPLGGRAWVRPGPEPAPGELFVSVKPHPEKSVTPPPEAAAVLELVDLERGTVRPVARDLAPIRWWFQPTVPAGSEASKLFLDDIGRLVRFDPATGERRVVLGRP